MITYAQACNDPNLFGPWFSGDSWATWRVLDKALFGEALDDDELATYTALTGRSEAPTAPASEAWLIMGRRSAKDVKVASICAYLATIGADRFDYARYLTPGERGVVQLLAVDRDQARVSLGYLKAFFEMPMLKQLVARQTADGLELTNRLAIEITTNDQRRVRGRTVIAAVMTEVAFFRSENSVSPDTDLYRALKPSMATIPTAMLLGISSPYARRGLLWNKYRTHYGKASPRVLVAQAATWIMNPTIPRDGEFLTEAFDDDPASAAAEFGARFRDDIEDFVSLDLIERAQREYPPELPYVPGTKFIAHCDPAGGGKDEFTISIAHREKERAVVDLLRGRRGSPAEIVAEYALLLKSYNIRTVTGDRYAGAWPGDEFARHAIKYEIADQDRSGLYLDTLAALNSGRVELPPCEILKRQFVGLERKTSKSGRDTVNHAPSSHDDRANSCAGAISATLKTAVRGRSMVDFL